MSHLQRHFRSGAGINTGTMEFFYRTRTRGCWTDGDFFFWAQGTRRAATCIHFCTCATQNIPRNGTGPTDGIGLSGTQLDRSRTGATEGCCFDKDLGKSVGLLKTCTRMTEPHGKGRPAGRLLCLRPPTHCCDSDCVGETDMECGRTEPGSRPTDVRRG